MISAFRSSAHLTLVILYSTVHILEPMQFATLLAIGPASSMSLSNLSSKNKIPGR